jgi:hypothetical protein
MSDVFDIFDIFDVVNVLLFSISLAAAVFIKIKQNKHTVAIIKILFLVEIFTPQ